jgi:hypothetical protein
LFWELEAETICSTQAQARSMAVVQCMHVRRYQTTYAPVSAARDAATCSCWQPANKPGGHRVWARRRDVSRAGPGSGSGSAMEGRGARPAGSRQQATTTRREWKEVVWLRGLVGAGGTRAAGRLKWERSRGGKGIFPRGRALHRFCQP